MLSRIVLALLIAIPLLGEARILETAHIANIAELIDEDTWLLINLDNTMFEAKQALGHMDWYHDQIQKRMEKGMPKEDAIKNFHSNWVKVQEKCLVKTLESNFIPFLTSLQHDHLIIMGLSDRQPSVANATVRQVASLGFNFAKTAPSKESLDVPSEYPARYLQGILFTGLNSPGEILNDFLTIINRDPKKMIYIDNRRKNVEDLENALVNVDYIGVVYTAKEAKKAIYSPELAEVQSKYFEKILSNEAAALLLQKKIK